ncbi:hypothetical protein MBM_07714 [Drepanopeziza brunnea f. sp. 'multigermtubi' MB_m1]|uniref:Uncharacterized protein n=1 Tax=Marssonina brunnea f. sp. multigermtubi (strain MB_m1) TaxID=1072389 RepID=K1WNX3_MARBU|nr:uncharacterized protein MBM_07714 [Drepanopeziza brunnea f. sp. 'multigermtubi' MB_m1]EKD14037.1 hypothetical protein MBM_07714 [Drepanopeziza brunnea f. sp. 'multigermtubi' MB_m1]
MFTYGSSEDGKNVAGDVTQRKWSEENGLPGGRGGCLIIESCQVRQGFSRDHNHDDTLAYLKLKPSGCGDLCVGLWFSIERLRYCGKKHDLAADHESGPPANAV